MKTSSLMAITLAPSKVSSLISCLEELTLNQGGILTVADDLLKNDGGKFLEMMEQLAVARVVREEQNVKDMQEETDEEDYDENECVFCLG